MKFLCDRCKTRYSIGDDRVRGKILKIRCKNCANVITVREGMSDADARPRRARRRRRRSRRHRRTERLTGAAPHRPPATAADRRARRRVRVRADQAAAALEEEWYVSIDGEQAGPFSLAEAQRWVAAKAFDAELHCWSEGFDDWLPSTRSATSAGSARSRRPRRAPPPCRACPTRACPRRAAAARPLEDEPKPLFAATMASLEKNAPATSSAGLGLPPPQPSTQPRLSATPPVGRRRRVASARCRPGAAGAGQDERRARAGARPDDPERGRRGRWPTFDGDAATADRAGPVRRRAGDHRGAGRRGREQAPRLGGRRPVCLATPASPRARSRRSPRARPARRSQITAITVMTTRMGTCRSARCRAS